jgi:hypothetical protein
MNKKIADSNEVPRGNGPELVGAGEVFINPELMTPSEMLQIAGEIVKEPCFRITYEGSPVVVAVDVLVPSAEGSKVDIDGFKVDGFTSSASTSKRQPKIWVPATTPRPWRQLELEIPSDPESKKQPVPKDFTSQMAQRWFNLIEGEGLREFGLSPVSVAEGESRPKQLTSITIWRMLDPALSPDDMIPYKTKVHTAYVKLFSADTPLVEIDRMTERFMAVIDGLRAIKPKE